MQTTNTLINVKNVSRQFVVGDRTIPVLKNVNFSVPEGSFTILYGASGSGKSTLLNILIGLDKPTTGEVQYGGRSIYGLSGEELGFFRANTMGMVQQSNYWVKSLTVLDNIAIPLYLVGYSRAQAAGEALASLKRVGMEQHAKTYPTRLSGGEQQRVAMARALVSNPTYIVADEPTGNLDSKSGDMIMELLEYFHRELHRTIILVTHNLEYLPYGDQLLFIQDGNVTHTSEENVQQTTDKILSDMKKRIDSLASKHGAHRGK